MGGIPNLPEPFVWCWTQMIQFNAEYLCGPGEYVHYDKSSVSFHSMARNQIAAQMHGQWLLMLDTDMTFEPDICARLLTHIENDGADIVTGVYPFKGSIHSPVIYTANDKGDLQPIGDWDRPDADRYLLPIDSAGGGCLMVTRSVFEKIKEQEKQEPFAIEPPFGEDHSFFRRAKRCGYKAFANPNIQCGHLAWKAWSMDDYKPEPEQLSERKAVSYGNSI